MTLSVTHTKVSAIADDPTASAAGEVLPSDWNASHTLTGGTTNSVLFVGAGSVLSQDNAAFNWVDSTKTLTLGDGSLNLTQITSQSGGSIDYGRLKFPVNLGGTYSSWNIYLSDATFAGVVDPVLAFGYNQSASGTLLVANEPALSMNIEANYNIGTVPSPIRTMEAYFSYVSSDGLTIIRPWSFQVRCDTNATIGFNISSAKVLLCDDTAGITYHDFRLGQYYNYNLFDPLGVNYERGIFQWVANTLLIGTQKGGTGSTRNIEFLIGGTNKLDYGVTTAATWNFASPIGLVGSSSGEVTVTAAAAAGTWTMTLPTSGGTNTYVLQTNGSGVTSWVPNGASSLAIGATVTSGTTGSVLFVDGGAALAQDNTNFFWDDSNDILKAGTQLQQSVNGTFVAALYPVYNATGDNWFVGESGNLGSPASMTGNRNMGMGKSSMAALTSGTKNVGVGQQALERLTTGTENVGIGNAALGHVTSGSSSIGIGSGALTTYNDTSYYSIGIGASAFGALATGANNIAIGGSAAASMTSGDTNIIIGDFAGGNISSGNSNVMLGNWAGPSGAKSNMIALSDGNGSLKLDYAYITANIWSIQRSTNASGLHVYRTWDGASPTVNYERAIFDWNAVANVLSIGTQAGGTGTTRNLELIVGGTNQLDYGVTNAATWTSPVAICVTPVAVASLPAAGIQGRRHFVTNATATTFASIVAGGGGNPVPVYDDGTNWRIG